MRRIFLSLVLVSAFLGMNVCLAADGGCEDKLNPTEKILSRSNIASNVLNTLYGTLKNLDGLSIEEAESILSQFEDTMLDKGHISWRDGYWAGLRKQHAENNQPEDLTIPRFKPLPKKDPQTIALIAFINGLPSKEKRDEYLTANKYQIVKTDESGQILELSQDINQGPTSLFKPLHLSLNGVHKKYAQVISQFIVEKLKSEGSKKSQQKVRHSDLTAIRHQVHNLWMKNDSYKAQKVFEKLGIAENEFYNLSVAQIVEVCEKTIKNGAKDNKSQALPVGDLAILKQFTSYDRLETHDQILDDRIIMDHANNMREIVKKAMAEKAAAITINVDLNDEKTMTEEGNFIHGIWQTVNSYRTRYKAVKDAAGKPITDIAKYISERNIPREYQGYYRRTVKGTYDEDIKQIPNGWLAANNSKENSDGAKSYLQNLMSMLKNNSPSKEGIYGALRNIHTEWYERNSSWTVSSGEARTFDESGIEGQYNGAFQFFKIAERHGVFKNQTWKYAFQQVVSDLAEKKFAPFREMSVEDAYIALTHKLGTKPSIEGDELLADFFDKKLRKYDFTLPQESAQEEAAVLQFLVQHFPSLRGGSAKDYLVKAPSVAPGSGARVYLIYEGKSDGKRLLAVIKIQKGKAGLSEVVAVAAAEKLLSHEGDAFKPVSTIALGRMNDDYFIIQEAAQSFEADHAFQSDLTSLDWMVVKAAEALAKIHGPVQTYSPEEVKGIGADLTTFKGNCFYDLRKMTEFLKRPAYEGGMISPTQAIVLSQGLTAITEEYSKIVELAPESLSPSEIHGDFHGGNLFLRLDVNGSMIIDYSGLTWFVGKKIGTGDRGNDLGRMVGNILVEAARYNMDMSEETLPLIDRLLAEYKREAKIQPGTIQEASMEVSVAFYLSRFLAINTMDVEGKKLKSLMGDSQRGLRQRLYQSWLKTLQHFHWIK